MNHDDRNKMFGEDWARRTNDLFGKDDMEKCASSNIRRVILRALVRRAVFLSLPFFGSFFA